MNFCYIICNKNEILNLFLLITKIIFKLINQGFIIYIGMVVTRINFRKVIEYRNTKLVVDLYTKLLENSSKVIKHIKLSSKTFIKCIILVMAVIHIESKARHIVLKELTVEHINIMVLLLKFIILYKMI